MVPLVGMVGEVIFFLVVATGDVGLVVLVVVMLVGVGMIVAHMIGTTIWMGVDGDVGGEGLTTEETLIGREAEVIAVALKKLEHGVIAEAAAAAAAVVEAEVGVGAGAGVVATAAALAAAVVVATAAALAVVAAVATAAAMTNMRGHMKETPMRKMLRCLHLRLRLNQGCLLCLQAHEGMHPLEPISLHSYQWLRVLKQGIQRML